MGWFKRQPIGTPVTIPFAYSRRPAVVVGYRGLMRTVVRLTPPIYSYRYMELPNRDVSVLELGED